MVRGILGTSSVLAIVCSASAAGGHERRHVDAHVHGEAELFAVVDEGRLMVELRSPLANFIGFEHAPRDAAEHAVLDAALSALSEDDALVVANPEAGCMIESVEVAPPEFAPHGDDGAADDPHHTDEGHAEIVTTHVFICTDIEALTSLDVPVLDAFPGIEEVEVTFVSDRRQTFQELKRGDRFDVDE